MDDATARGDHMVVELIDGRSVANHKRQVLQPSLFGRVRAGERARVEEEERARSVVGGLVGELVVGGEEGLEANQRHQGVVVALRRREVGNVDAEVTEHLLSIGHTIAEAG